MVGERARASGPGGLFRLPVLQPEYLGLARFGLENNYVECQGIEGAFLQKIGTAMGTSFSVTYATIFMIWLETPKIDHFREHIVLYKRYMDDILLIWSGSAVELCRFRALFGAANKHPFINIKPFIKHKHQAGMARNADRRRRNRPSYDG